jgi:hypothetical protein
MSLLAFTASEGHELAPMVMDPIWFAVIAGVAFVFLGFVVWSFRDVSNRHRSSGPVTDRDSTHGVH